MDTRSQIRTYIAVFIVGFGLIILFQIWLNLHFNWFNTFWDVLICIPLYFLWISYGASYISKKIINLINKKKDVQ